jgi:hypothetical protein
LLLPVQAWAQSCPPAPSPQLNVTVAQDPLRYDNSYNIHQLKDLMQRDGDSYAAGGHRHIPLGLARVQSSFKSGLEALVTRLPDGTYCASLKSVDFDLRFTDNTVFVAVELPRDSCIYREVLAHEHKHVAVDAQLLNEWNSRLRTEVTHAVSTVGTVSARSSDEAVKLLSARLEPNIRRTMDALMAERAHRQAQVDTPEEYHRVSRSCNGEVRKYVPEGMLR